MNDALRDWLRTHSAVVDWLEQIPDHFGKVSACGHTFTDWSARPPTHQPDSPPPHPTP